MDNAERDDYIHNFNFLINSIKANNVQLLPVIIQEGKNNVERMAICHVHEEQFVPMAIMTHDNPFDYMKPNLGDMKEITKDTLKTQPEENTDASSADTTPDNE